MAGIGKRWTVQDRYGKEVYLTQERWTHILEDNHPELEDYEGHLKLTIQRGRRVQEPQNPRKYRYLHQFDDLPEDFTHVVAIVVIGVKKDIHDIIHQNNWIATAYFKSMRGKGN